MEPPDISSHWTVSSLMSEAMANLSLISLQPEIRTKSKCSEMLVKQMNGLFSYLCPGPRTSTLFPRGRPTGWAAEGASAGCTVGSICSHADFRGGEEPASGRGSQWKAEAGIALGTSLTDYNAAPAKETQRLLRLGPPEAGNHPLPHRKSPGSTRSFCFKMAPAQSTAVWLPYSIAGW